MPQDNPSPPTLFWRMPEEPRGGNNGALLHINAAARPRGVSRSLRVADAFLEGFREAHPDAPIDEIELFSTELGMVDSIDANTRLHQFRGQELEGEEAERMGRFRRVIEPLLRCDRLLVTTPMWNLGPPWKLKQWLDTVMQARITFRYTEHGPEGLVKARGAIVGSRGGAYPDGDPSQTRDFLVPYLRTALGTMGIDMQTVCLADGLDAAPEKSEELLLTAEQKARQIGRVF